MPILKPVQLHALSRAVFLRMGAADKEAEIVAAAAEMGVSPGKAAA